MRGHGSSHNIAVYPHELTRRLLPSVLRVQRDELRAAKGAVKVLKLDKVLGFIPVWIDRSTQSCRISQDRTHHKLERLDSLLVKER